MVDELRDGSAAEYDPASRAITFAMNSADPQAVMQHELVHDARAYFATKPENAMLDRVFREGSRASEQVRAAVERQGYEPAVSQLGHIEERIAHAGQLISAGKLHLDPTTNGILNRLWRTFDRIRNWVNGAGFNTAEEFLRGIQEGKLAGREPVGLRAGPVQEARLPRAADILSEAYRTSMDRPPETILDKILSTPFRMLPVHRLYAQAMDALGKWVPERIKAGIVDRYGEGDEQKQANWRLLGARRAHQREVQTYAQRLMGALENRAVARAAYWAHTSLDPEAAAEAFAQVPEEARPLVRELKQHFSDLGKQAVDLNLVSREAQARNDMTYLHRMYARYELDADGKPTQRRQAALRILGDQWKGRGPDPETVRVDRLQRESPNFDPASAKGRMFQRLIRTNQDGDVNRYAWVEDGQTLPERYTGPDWSPEKDSAGVTLKYEARWPQGPEGRPHSWKMWRDYTPAEQKENGVLDEYKYVVARTLHATHMDIDTARHFRWIAGQPDLTRATSDDLPAGAVPIADTPGRYKAYLPNEWVQVPNAEIPKSGGVKSYGDLAGKWVSGPVWNEVRQIGSLSPALRWPWYDKMVRIFKISKTALSPMTHVNNVMSNFVFADWADVRPHHLLESFMDHIRAWRGDPAGVASLKELEDAGGSFGHFRANELKNEVFAPLEEALRTEMLDAQAEGASHPLALTRALHLVSTGLTGLRAIRDGAMDLYSAEDNIMRLAAYKKAIADGMDTAHAAAYATQAFHNYDIHAPWINLARKTAFPFLAFTYRAIPMLNRIVQEKPWKIAKLAAVAGLLNAVGYAASSGNEEAERAMLPPERSGKIWGILPRAIRMPWNSSGSPVFQDITRWIPMGDLFNYEQSQSAIPVLPMMVPGGPLELLAEFLSNKDSYTGSPITLESDTGVEKAWKVTGHLWKGMSPNLAVWPGSYNYDKVFPTLPAPVQTGLRAVGLGGQGPAMDPFGREYPKLEAWMNAFGFKIAAYPKDMLELRMMQNANFQVSELQRQIQQLGKKYERGAIDQKEFDSRIDTVSGKIQKIMEDVNGRLVKGQGMR